MTSVKVVGAYCVYHNYMVWDLADGQQVDGELADHLLAQGLPVEVLSVDEAPDVDGDGVPDGSAAQVLGWVGADPDRARRALAAEQAREKPRTGLVAALGKLIPAEPPAGGQPPAGGTAA